MKVFLNRIFGFGSGLQWMPLRPKNKVYRKTVGVSNPAVIKEFPNNNIFTCDAKFNWQRYK